MNQKGINYLRGRAASDGRVSLVLTDIGRCDSQGQMALRDTHRRTLDELIYKRDDEGQPMYTADDVRYVAREAYDRSIK